MTDQPVTREELEAATTMLTEAHANLDAQKRHLDQLAAVYAVVGDLTLRSSAYIAAKEQIPPAHAARLHRALALLGEADPLHHDRVAMLTERAERGDDWANDVVDLIEAGE